MVKYSFVDFNVKSNHYLLDALSLLTEKLVLLSARHLLEHAITVFAQFIAPFHLAPPLFVNDCSKFLDEIFCKINEEKLVVGSKNNYLLWAELF